MRRVFPSPDPAGIVPVMTSQTTHQELERARALWKQTATMQGIVCVDCRDAPALEHRDAFFDTGVCERCWPATPPDRRH
jgi:hypothetical protein